MRILLLSPLRGLDPACGDVVYTETLLANPPDGVQFETYAAALERGALIEHASRPSLYRAWRTGRGRLRETWTTALAKGVNLLRRRRWLFWEPLRIFSLRPGEFDLVHVHVFSCGFREIDCPLAVSNALPLRYLYTDARGYSLTRTRGMEWFERLVAKIFGVNLTSYWLPQAQRVIAFSNYLREWYADRGIIKEDAIDVVPIYLPSTGQAAVHPRPRRIGFIAKDFEAKGGPLLLEAFALVRRKLVDAELVIVGCEARLNEGEQAERGIQWLSLVPREDLLDRILPSFDVFAYPTRFDGMPLVLLEAMSRGIALAATSYRAIPEMLDLGRAGLLSPPGDAQALAANLIALLEPETNRRYRAAAYAHFEATYSAFAVRPQLAASYRRAAGEHARNKPRRHAAPLPVVAELTSSKPGSSAVATS